MHHRLPVIPYDVTGHDEVISGHISTEVDYGVIRPEGRGDLLLLYTLQGSGYIHTPNTHCTTTADQLCLLREDVPHEYGTSEETGHWEFLWVHFRTFQVVTLLPQDEVLQTTIQGEYFKQRVRSAFEHVFYHAAEQSDFGYLLCENSIREMILLLMRGLNTRRDPRVTQALQLLSQSYREPLVLRDLAAAIGLSESRLSHLFKEELGLGVIEYMNRMRVQQAASMMFYMDRTASEAALDVGFNSYNHFASLFRKHYGVSPRSYKQGNREHRQMTKSTFTE